MNMLDLFSGIGGFHLAAEWVWGDDLNVVTHVEIDPFCQKVLRKHWPDVPIHDDIRSYKHDGTRIDLLTGGYPCQPFSTACHGQNIAEDLSPWMRLVCQAVKPRYIIAENVAEETIAGFEAWCRSVGYGAFRCRVGAFEIGADHKRNRWFGIAYPNDKSELHGEVYAEMARVQSLQNTTWRRWGNYARTFRVHDGIPNRTHRLKALGNAIVPQVVVPIMQAIKEQAN